MNRSKESINQEPKIIDFPKELWVYNGKQRIKPTDMIKSTRRLNSFCVAAGLRNCVVKAQGGWYWITLDGEMSFIERTLGNITFETIYNLLKNN